MATATDTFTDTAGVNLTAHTADTGESYTKASGMTGNMVIYTDGTQLQGSGLIDDGHYSSFVPATAEYDITLSLSNVPAGNVQQGILGRQSTTANTKYWGFWHGSNARWELRQVIAGASTTLSTAATNNPEGTTGDFKMEIRDATKKLFWGATELLSSTDNTITAAGRGGLIGGDINTSRSTTFVIADVAAGGTAGRLVNGCLVNGLLMGSLA